MDDPVYFSIHPTGESPCRHRAQRHADIERLWRRRDLVGSLKAISDDGGFDLRDPMHPNDTLPICPTRAVMDRDLFHRTPDCARRCRRIRLNAGATFNASEGHSGAASPAPVRAILRNHADGTICARLSHHRLKAVS